MPPFLQLKENRTNERNQNGKSMLVILLSSVSVFLFLILSKIQSNVFLVKMPSWFYYLCMVTSSYHQLCFEHRDTNKQRPWKYISHSIETKNIIQHFESMDLVWVRSLPHSLRTPTWNLSKYIRKDAYPVRGFSKRWVDTDLLKCLSTGSSLEHIIPSSSEETDPYSVSYMWAALKNELRISMDGNSSWS